MSEAAAQLRAVRAPSRFHKRNDARDFALARQINTHIDERQKRMAELEKHFSPRS